MYKQIAQLKGQRTQLYKKITIAKRMKNCYINKRAEPREKIEEAKIRRYLEAINDINDQIERMQARALGTVIEPTPPRTSQASTTSPQHIPTPNKGNKKERR